MRRRWLSTVTCSPVRRLLAAAAAASMDSQTGKQARDARALPHKSLRYEID